MMQHPVHSSLLKSMLLSAKEDNCIQNDGFFFTVHKLKSDNVLLCSILFCTGDYLIFPMRVYVLLSQVLILLLLFYTLQRGAVLTFNNCS